MAITGIGLNIATPANKVGSILLETTPNLSTKFFDLVSNNLSGEYKVVEDAGIWGDVLANSAGVISPAFSLTYTVDSGKEYAHTIRLLGDAVTGNYPVDYTVKLYDAGALVHTETVVGNTNIDNVVYLNKTVPYTSYTIEVSKVSKAGNVAKLRSIFSPDVVKRTVPTSVAISATSDLSQALYPTSTDAAALRLASTRSMNVDVYEAPQSKLAETHTAATMVSISTSDTLALASASDDVVGNSFSASETLRLVGSTNIHTLVAAALQDALSIRSSSPISGLLNELSSPGSLVVTGSTTKPDINVDMQQADTVSISSGSAVAMCNTFSRESVLGVGSSSDTHVLVAATLRDTLNLESFNPTSDILNSFSKQAQLVVSSLLHSVPTNVHTAYSSHYREVLGKVRIRYTSPLVLDAPTFSSSGEAYGSAIEQTTNMVTNVSIRGLPLAGNKLDGSFYPIAANETEVGWWSDKLSDANGAFAEPVWIMSSFTARPLFSTMVSGDAAHGVYPVDFTVDVIRADATKVSFEVTDNTGFIKEIPFEAPIEAVAVKLTIRKINRPNFNAIISELLSVADQSYEMAMLQSIDLLEEVTCDDNAFTSSSISANMITIALNNEDGRFTPNGKSVLAEHLKRNRRVEAWLGIEVLPDYVEWHSLGVFWAYKWNLSSNKLIMSVTAYDTLSMLSTPKFFNHDIYTGKTLKWLAEHILQDAQRVFKFDYVVDAALDTFVVPVAWFNFGSYIEALKRLGTTCSLSIFCDRQGRVVVTGLASSTPEALTTLDDSSSIINREYPIHASDMINTVDANVASISFDTSQELLQGMAPVFITPDKNEYYLIFQSPAKDLTVPAITKDASVTIHSSEVHSWGIRVVASSTGPGYITAVAISGTPIKVSKVLACSVYDTSAVYENGEVKYTIDSDFIQNAEQATTLASSILSNASKSKHNLQLDYRGDASLTLNDKLTVTDTPMPYVVKRHELTWTGSLTGKLLLDT